MSAVKHAVFVKFRPEVGQREIADVMADLAALRRKLPGLLDFSWGANASPEGLNRGFTHGFVMTFANAQARDEYLPHPDHEAVKEKILPLLDGGFDAVLVLDWEHRD